MNTSPERATVVVTGAAGALGAATAAAFAAAGFDVIGLDIDPAVAMPGPSGVRGIEVDLTDETAVQEVLSDVADGGGRLAHLVGIAGGALPQEPVTQHDLALLAPEVFRGSIERNLTSQFLVVQAALPWFRRVGSPDRSVTFISSWNATSARGMPAYSAAKAGLIGMMHALVRPLGAENIRVNVVAPGTIRTPRTERIWAHDEGHFERLAQEAAIGRLGVPQDVAQTCLALARDLTHVCGQVLVVDGGQSV